MVRLFVYTAEALEKPEPERSILVKQFQKMQKGLWYGITWPSMLITLALGSTLAQYLNYWAQPWMLAKLFFVLLLVVYHGICHGYFIDQQRGENKKTPYFYRLWNELATVFLFAIVFCIVWKDQLTLISSIISFSIFSMLIFGAVYFAKKKRDQNSQKP